MWYDENISHYGDINFKINKLYCDKYNYNIIKSSERLIPKRSAHWERIPLLLHLFSFKMPIKTT